MAGQNGSCFAGKQSHFLGKFGNARQANIGGIFDIAGMANEFSRSENFFLPIRLVRGATSQEWWSQMTQKTPSEKGYRMPAEWEPHEATWISWPHADCNSFPGAYDRVIPTFVAMAGALAESETVRINVKNAEQEKTVRRLLKKCPPERLEFFHIPTDEPWCRDHGPIFVVRDKDPQIGRAHV